MATHAWSALLDIRAKETTFSEILLLATVGLIATAVGADPARVLNE